MKQQDVRKTYQYKLYPTPEHEMGLEGTLAHYRMLCNCTLEQRKTWWGRGQGIGASYYQQASELTDLKVACPNMPPCIPTSCKTCYAGWTRRIKRSSVA